MEEETVTLPQRSSGSSELREEIRNTLAARQELGSELDDELVESFARRIQGVIAEEVARQVGTRSDDAKQLREWRKEMYAITLGIGLPILIVGAFAAELLGVVVVCVMLVLVSFAWTMRSS